MLDQSHHHPIDQDWQHRASCRGTDTDMFFSPDGEHVGASVPVVSAPPQICHNCPVLADCRAHALTTTEAYGIWGGMSETERARRTRRRARHTARPARMWERRTT
ncbi:WhiB family transcriptional regulator [Rhodococcus opacus]|uniref:WhiB family transcriptional regulator n=1 Tax=Rhodococcus opacus TaxID=37919 RepID=UPI001F56351C|nr:WhiB family transcriptional regulator [Rhodococcus opacus]UNN01116.1 WhiB family transcriptional regulator [Rhodococcus opacus]